jgi:3-methyladenine DNA glycosylase AlkD
VDRGTVVKRLRALGDPGDAAGMQRYFKNTGDDEFLGIRAAVMRGLAREYQALPFSELGAMLDSRVHEERALALLILVRRFRKEPDAVTRLYFEKIDRVNNWDLVDLTARDIVGARGDLKVLDRLSKSSSLWERRIAMVATQHFIRRNEFDPALRLAERLLGDPEDLIHKAVGWMLREVGDRDRPVLQRFLSEHAHEMPRTMLRYAIEKFPQAERQQWLRGSRAAAKTPPGQPPGRRRS